TDAGATGYTAENASSLAQAIIQKIEDSGIAGLTFSEASGVITITKSGAIDISSAANAQASVNLVDAAIAQVNEQRAKLGAISNRLEMTVTNLTNIVTNLAAGRGRIEDADFAAESTELARTQILQQASMAMLSQANASKQSVMNLLQGR
ncbi:MAG: flagellin, partial [Gemmobacter sp.]